MKASVSVLLALLGAIVVGLIIFAVRRDMMLPPDLGGTRSYELAEKPELRFFVLGDTGSGDTHQRQVGAAMEAECQALGGIDALLLLGDQFYMEGVDSLDDPQWKTKIEIPYGSECLSKAPIYPILGNHDYRGNVEAMLRYDERNPRWHLPHRFYRVDYGSMLRIVAFDSTFPDFCLFSNKCSVDFLLDSLNKSDARWKIVLSHLPLASASLDGYSHSGATLFGYLMRFLVCDRTDVWFSGHAHHLEHRNHPGCAASLLVAGGGGGDLENVPDFDPASMFIRKAHGFGSLHITNRDLGFRFISDQGEVLYSTHQIKPK